MRAGFPYYELGLDGDFVRIIFAVFVFYSSQKSFCGDFSHLSQRLADGGQARIVEGGALDIVKADY